MKIKSVLVDDLRVDLAEFIKSDSITVVVELADDSWISSSIPDVINGHDCKARSAVMAPLLFGPAPLINDIFRVN